MHQPPARRPAPLQPATLAIPQGDVDAADDAGVNVGVNSEGSSTSSTPEAAGRPRTTTSVVSFAVHQHRRRSVTATIPDDVPAARSLQEWAAEALRPRLARVPSTDCGAGPVSCPAADDG